MYINTTSNNLVPPTLPSGFSSPPPYVWYFLRSQIWSIFWRRFHDAHYENEANKYLYIIPEIELYQNKNKSNLFINGGGERPLLTLKELSWKVLIYFTDTSWSHNARTSVTSSVINNVFAFMSLTCGLYTFFSCSQIRPVHMYPYLVNYDTKLQVNSIS